MIYFIQDTVTRAIKIGYSTNPQKRLKNLQNSNQNKLVLLYAMHGELEHEAELLQRFDKFKMEGEWFKAEIAGAVSQIIATDKLNPRQPSFMRVPARPSPLDGSAEPDEAHDDPGGLAVQHRRGDVRQFAALEKLAAADVFDFAVGRREKREEGGGVGRVITEQPQELS